MIKERRYSRGFTLIEVLMALVIAVVGISALLGGMMRCLAVVSTARDQEMARSLLRRVDIEYPIDGKTVAETSDSGDFDDFPSYSWSRNILMVDEEERPGLFLVTTRVEWSRRSRTAGVEITTYRYAPESENVKKKI